MLIGAQTAGKIEGWYTTSEAVAASKRVETIGPEVAALQQQLASASADEKTALDEQIAQLKEEKSQKRMEYLRNIDWKPLWGIPAIFAGIIMLLFAFMFREDSPEGSPAS